jgi:hypothetical protein
LCRCPQGNTQNLAEVAELVDALASGASGGNPVEVQVLSSAPNTEPKSPMLASGFFISGYLPLCKRIS